MNGNKMLVIAMLSALLTAACGGTEDSPAPAGERGQEDVAQHMGGPASPDGAPGATPGRGTPMGGNMGKMHARMMGGSSPEDAPEAVAAAASAPGCPDVSQELADRGRGVWTGSGNCYTCHGGDATGSQLAPDLTDAEWLNVEGGYGSIRDVVRTGVSQPRQYPAPMPPMGGGSLSQDQVCAVAAYVYSLSH